MKLHNGSKDELSKSKISSNLNTPLSRTRSGSRSSAGSSPAALHGRVPPLKTAVVAPTKFTPKSGGLNRFGFRNSTHSKSGDSTDSVNSILSDAQTVSDSNLNIFELCDDENENKSTNGTVGDSAAQCDNARIHLSVPESPAQNAQLNANFTASQTFIVPKQSPGLQSSRITAVTRQLPKPQAVTVKSVSPKNLPSPCNGPKTHCSLSHITPSRDKCPSVQSLVHTPVNQSPTAKQHLMHTAVHIPRVSRDSESSTKSVTEVDSGLGSSSESDKIRGECETETLDLSQVESTEDMSDAWLKKMRQEQSVTKRKSRGSTEIQLSGSNSFEVKRQSLEIKDGAAGSETKFSTGRELAEPVKERRAEAAKEKRDTTITYGMARQKFAPYSRNRYGYGYQSSASRIGGGTSGFMGSSNSSSPGVTKIPGSAGLVRSRVALLETPQTKKAAQQTPVLRRSNVKKPQIRPTSIEKTPVLVMPVMEKTVDLSKPVCRKLEYSENSVPKLDAQKDSLDSDVQEGKKDLITVSRPVIEDLLIVGSVEVETHKDSNMVLEVDNHGSFYENLFDKVPAMQKSADIFKVGSELIVKMSESKANKDISESEKIVSCENKTAVAKQLCSVVDTKKEGETVEECRAVENGEAVRHSAETPDDSGIKILSPQSESSFEILESLSETSDLTSDEAKETSEHTVNEESSATSRSPSFDTKRDFSIDSASSSSDTTVAAIQKEKMNEVVSNGEDETARSSNGVLAAQSMLEHSFELVSAKAVSTVTEASSDKKPSQYTGLPTGKSSNDLRFSMESSVDSHKSLSMVNAMTESGELSSLSGKNTPTLNTGRSDLDQDFLIDDEIADQPGLMFGGSTMASSFFTDDGLFDDLASSPPSHAQLKQVAGSSRSRANSVDTASSVCGDDLMLDYFDIEEGKAGGYDEEVLSPDANEIFSEWTAMMAEVSSANSERCVSRESSSGGGRTSRPRLSSASELSSPDPRRPTVLRPPRQCGVTEAEGIAGGGGVFVDRTSYHYMCQDVTALKTMLLRLRRVLQAADTINPFDANLRNSLYLSLASSDATMINGDKDSLTPSVTELSQENIDLRRQVVLLQQQLEDKDRTIRLLQQQLSQSLQTQQPSASSTPPSEVEAISDTVNAATQTDRSSRPALRGSSLSRTASIDDGLGPTVSSEVDCDCMARGRSLASSEHRQPRAASQPPTLFMR